MTSNINGNKLRIFRLFKTSVETAKYNYRGQSVVLPLFRSCIPKEEGSLPLAIETGRYVRPQMSPGRPCGYFPCEATVISSINSTH
jgi:hypothetical protein